MRHGTCAHYNGMRDLADDPEPRQCLAGVCYEKAFGTEPGIAGRAPCIEFIEHSPRGGTYLRPGEVGIKAPWMPHIRAKQAVIPCRARIEPTDEQVLKSQQESEAHLTKAFAGIKLASEWRVTPKPKQPRHEIVECPVCKGRLHLSQSAINGHVHGQCETPKCVAWME